MKVARVDKDRTKLSTLEQLISLLKKEIISIEHDDPIIFHQVPCIEFVQCQLESKIKIGLISVWISQIFNTHHLCPIFLFPRPQKQNRSLHFQQPFACYCYAFQGIEHKWKLYHRPNLFHEEHNKFNYINCIISKNLTNYQQISKLQFDKLSVDQFKVWLSLVCSSVWL